MSLENFNNVGLNRKGIHRNVRLCFKESGSKVECLLGCKASISPLIAVMKRHLIAIHPREASNLNLSESDGRHKISHTNESYIRVRLSKAKVNKFFINLLTKHNIPLNFPEYDTVKEFFHDIYKELNIQITYRNGIELVSKVANKIRLLIAAELSNCLFSLKMDSAKRCNRNVLGK